MTKKQKEELGDLAEFFKNLDAMKGKKKKKRGTYGFPDYLRK